MPVPDRPVPDRPVPDLPLPPPELRVLVGPTDPAAFDNPSGDPPWPELPAAAYASVFDFGCGCGRLARQLRQMRTPPRRYLGVDVHRGMVAWAQANLATPDGSVRFEHHDGWSPVFNPGGRPPEDPPALPGESGAFGLVLAWSVFTHLVEPVVPHYLRECARLLRPDGVLRSTWFLTDKRWFPMMQGFQHCLYINYVDPTNAVIVDQAWLWEQVAAAGLVVAAAVPPALRGYQWILDLRPAASGAPWCDLPADTAPLGHLPPPLGPVEAHRIGLPPV